MEGLRAFLLCILLTVTPIHSQLTLEDTGSGFTISFDGNKILEHTQEDPVLSLGYGEANFTEQHGNFQIDDDVITKLPFTEFQDQGSSGEQVTLTLWPSTDPSLIMDLVVTVVPVTVVHNEITLMLSPPTDNLPAFAAYNRMWVRLWAYEEEMVWGGGEQYTYLNLRGRHYPIWTSEQGVGRDNGIIANASDLDGGAGGEYYTTYWPQASFLSSRLYSILISDRNYLVLNFTDSERHEVYMHNIVFQASLIWGSSLMETVQDVTKMLGTQPVLPDWIMGGAILGVQEGTDSMLYYYELAKAAGTNISGLWIQDWSGKTETLFGHRVYWNWRWNETYYENLDVVIQDLMTEGVRVLAYINVHLITGSEMYEEAAALGYLLKDADGQVFDQDYGGFTGGTLDLISEEGRAWYKDEIIKNMINLGLGGWMADFGEYTRLDMYSANQDYNAQERHNLMPVRWATCNREAVETAGKLGEVVYFMRAGGLGSSGDQVLAWAGDQNVDWSLGDGVATTIVAALNLAVSGMGVTHFDIGGYTTQPPVLARSKELFLRSAEYAVFTPVMRTHEGNKPDANHQFYSDEDTLLQFARLTQIHARLLPYTRSLLEELSTQGKPVQRPLFLEFEGDLGSYEVTYQYMYGADLLVAPIIHKLQETQMVYLPDAGTGWVHFWGESMGDGAAVMGPTNITVATPMGFPAVFYRQDSIWQPLFSQIDQEFGMGSYNRWFSSP